MKGIILAGGRGTRLHPITHSVNKQLIPVYDKPMIYYPLSVLMLAGIREVLIVSSRDDLPGFRHLLGDGSRIGMSFSYVIQESPEGLPQAFTLGGDFIGGDSVCLVLGDNIFFGQGFRGVLRKTAEFQKGGVIFGYWVRDPERYGVVEFDQNKRAVRVEEKPANPRSSYAVVGLYFFDSEVVQIASGLTKSARGEYEMADVINEYIQRQSLQVQVLGRGFAWLDTGTHESLLEASNFVETIEKRQGLKIACVEEVAFRMGFIDRGHLLNLASEFNQNSYGRYLKMIAEEE